MDNSTQDEPASRSYRISADAENDLRSISRYLTTHGSIEVADKFIDTIFGTFETLAFMPGIGRKRPESSETTRCYALPPYVIYFEPILHGVLILRILHGAQDQDTAFRGGS